VHIEKDYVDQLIKNVQPLSSLLSYSCSHAQSNIPSSEESNNIGEQPLEFLVKK